MHDEEIKKQQIQQDPIFVHTPSAGTTDFATEQYHGIEYAINKPADKQYPERTDSTGTEFYGKKGC